MCLVILKSKFLEIIPNNPKVKDTTMLDIEMKKAVIFQLKMQLEEHQQKSL